MTGHQMRFGALGLCAFVLGACEAANNERTEYERLLGASTTLADIIERQSPTAPSDLPITGSATYDGFLSADAIFDSTPTEIDSIIGVSTIVVNFDGSNANPFGSFTGEATGFYDDQDNRIPGTLVYEGQYDNAILEGVLSGDLEIEAGTISGTGTMIGRFRGEQGRYIRADVNDGVITGAETGTFTAVITGEN